MVRKILIVVVVAVLIGLLARNISFFSTLSRAPTPDDQQIADAFANRQSNLQVAGQGKVLRILPDDDKGRRHQKFILVLASGQTLLVAHNIDIAPRIKDLRVGDAVSFYGEYEWNAKGGVIHWTHHDPHGRHADGWLKHKGKRYE